MKQFDVGFKKKRLHGEDAAMEISFMEHHHNGLISLKKNDQINLLKEDMGNRPQWPFTSYAVFPGTANDIIGDISFEELRCLELRQLLIEGKNVDEVKHNTFLLAQAANQKFENFAKKILESQEFDHTSEIIKKETFANQEEIGINCNYNINTLDINYYPNDPILENHDSDSMDWESENPDSSFGSLDNNNNHHNHHHPSTATFTSTFNEISPKHQILICRANNEETTFVDEKDPIIKIAAHLFNSKPWELTNPSASASASSSTAIHENPWTAEFFSYIPEDPPPPEYCLQFENID